MKGIHLNSRNPIAPDNYSGHISASCHTLEEVQEDKKTCDYVFLSPIFDSISKEGYSSKFTPEAIREAVKADIIDKKVIALGGIDEENILRVRISDLEELLFWVDFGRNSIITLTTIIKNL